MQEQAWNFKAGPSSQEITITFIMTKYCNVWHIILSQHFQWYQWAAAFLHPKTSRSSVPVAETRITKILKSIKFVFQQGVRYHWQVRTLKLPVSAHKVISCLFHELCFINFPNLYVSFWLDLRAIRLLVSSGTLLVISTSSYWQKKKKKIPGSYGNI